MPTAKRPRRGSLQFYPRKRARKALHRVNFKPILEKNSEEGVLGFIGYKVGMASVVLKDQTPKVMTSGKQIITPATILEVPGMKIFSVRFFKNKKLISEVVVSQDKELKRKVKLSKTLKKLDGNVPEGFDDVKIIVYSVVKETGVKKTPDLIELAVNADDKLEYVKSLIGKEIGLDNFSNSGLVDVRAVTKGKGMQGPVKRFGITLRHHKSEKGVRKVGSIGPWHPARVMFRVPMAGQTGLFSRIIYNLNVLSSGKISEKDINPASGFRNYGKVKTSYVILKGSVQGPAKRQVVLTPAFRKSKKQKKQKLEFVGLLK